jgi:hypothetical protein
MFKIETVSFNSHSCQCILINIYDYFCIINSVMKMKCRFGHLGLSFVGLGCHMHLDIPQQSACTSIIIN